MEKNMLFSAKNISKSFSGNLALSDVSMDIGEGEIIGLVGENGAGKSTLLKIMIGVQPPTEGEMFMRGEPYSAKSHLIANGFGMSMVFQEQSLITNLPVYQNIFFGHEKWFQKNGFINWKKCREEAQNALNEVGATDIDPNTKVLHLNFAKRQMVEIAKAVYIAKRSGQEHCLILLDEPTSVLNEKEVENLFVQVRHLKELGHSVVFVSHRLQEVLDISDRIYVFKDGKCVTNMPVSEASEDVLYENMVGRSTPSSFYHTDEQFAPKADVLLEVDNLGLHGCFKGLSFKLHRSEILGLAGVVGSGVEEACSVICGDDAATSGKIIYKGKETVFHDPSAALKQGILMVPKERLFEGIFLDLANEDNVVMSSMKKISKGPFLPPKTKTELAEKWIETLKIKTLGPKEISRKLSGGNQQKVVFSRALASEADIIILNHPTRGVDVGAKEEIYHLIRTMVNSGKSVILLGDTLDECIGLSNRIIVMKDGLVTKEFDAPANAKPDQVSVVSCML